MVIESSGVRWSVKAFLVRVRVIYPSHSPKDSLLSMNPSRIDTAILSKNHLVSSILSRTPVTAKKDTGCSKLPLVIYNVNKFTATRMIAALKIILVIKRMIYPSIVLAPTNLVL